MSSKGFNIPIFILPALLSFFKVSVFHTWNLKKDIGTGHLIYMQKKLKCWGNISHLSTYHVKPSESEQHCSVSKWITIVSNRIIHFVGYILQECIYLVSMICPFKNTNELILNKNIFTHLFGGLGLFWNTNKNPKQQGPDLKLGSPKSSIF